MLRWLTLLSCILLTALHGNIVEDVGAAQQASYPPPPPPFPFNVIVILPKRESTYDNFGMTLQKAMPVIDIAVQEVIKAKKLPPGWINLTYWDSRLYEDILLAERHATVGVIQAYCEHRLDAILGFADNYGLATVTKVTAGLNGGIPILTTSGMPSLLNSKKEYPFLTRMQGSYRLLADSMYQLIAYHDEDSVSKSNSSLNYLNLIFFYHDKRRAVNRVIAQDESQETGATSSHCYFSLYAIKRYFTEKSKTFKREWALNTPQFPFDEDLVIERETFKQWLREISLQSNVIILCASPDTVREIMLAAHDLGMATSGEYVFINIDVSTGSHAEQPWIRANDTNNEENEKAKEAYRALKTISLRRSDLDEYKNFELRVKERADQKYNYTNITGKDYEMNNFISAFYDAVLLYAIALNETIQSGLDPRNGHNITSRMWGRTFVGITGNVSIDHNGDRYSDYSLLDLDPVQNRFVEVAYYSGASNQLKTVGQLHWVGGKPPTDLPICGYDKSKCPGYPLHVYLLMGSFLLILVLVGLFIFFWRRYKLEQELAAMSWKIRWEELDGEESQKKNEKKKAKKRKNHNDYLPESDPLLRSTSRSSVNSDKFDEDSLIPIRFRLRSSSSGTTRKISAMIDRKLSIFTRKKSTPPSESQKNGGLTPNSLQKAENGDCSPINEVQFRLPLNDRRVSSPSSEATRKKNSNEEDPENGAKKSLSLKNRKLSFGMVSFKSGSGGSVETIAQNNTQIYTKTAIFKGVVVAIKKLNIDPKKYPRLDLSRAQLMELKKMKDLQHDHITRFTGACIDFPHYCVVTEYCPKGSLEDILENEKIELDKLMKYSLLHDLVKGLFFLHNSEIRSHGRLKSSNCVVDSRFVLKVTDFGLHRLHCLEEINLEEIGEHAYYKKMLWTAPELLRDSNAPPMGTQKGDIYSFAIILHEMMFRKGVFALENEDLSPNEIVQRVRKPVSEDQEPLRPWVSETGEGEGDDALNDTLLSLMVACWSEDPHERPEVSSVRKAVRSLNRDNETSNLVDNLLKRMEQYANNLEGLVEERTQEYLAEKKKVEELLHQLLPPAIADTLIAGRAVQAESYDCVTIYFSDIVGFTSLSSQSTPMQVVTLLNDLYLAFDGVVDNFKVYKVETIGDAYMVVSGLPERRDDHANQIAQMSLSLLHKVKNFVIRHRPHEQLKLRIGMHSGSVVAGVVGSKMPRYCLFGDTVNTSSRMESNGLPLKIHVSQQTYDILMQEAGFKLELRGSVEMKGKGMQTTYWLRGYKDVEIPDFGEEFA
ncbi:Receptor-type guanylate cyclase gcy-28 [Caenorhabditis elegans]|uniref:Receptor-type guanylate cyclase gcy-28 n=1 Tax=Caenorhabditis elegans TaxID=6239 RepID=GCY28_CAEEL|nr:Receptor-type guanylate cyclase gcy-28 [Caenorhabditis elegans]Q86GV3.1 RecName: Full=Receptor-type guanylate cyclase gcy-28; AltName: Full=GCY-X1; Flags: Precursor [Caenorhabditis elegans]CCD73355.1 Receptor-type guanylate cyclase gcy-28 [Caenorhabditis elegans]|eukprot:NP_001021600.1 Receptor-type guanylate cyclase gcy-28 [Caenorhabditis elegans]